MAMHTNGVHHPFVEPKAPSRSSQTKLLNFKFKLIFVESGGFNQVEGLLPADVFELVVSPPRCGFGGSRYVATRCDHAVPRRHSIMDNSEQGHIPHECGAGAYALYAVRGAPSHLCALTFSS